MKAKYILCSLAAGALLLTGCSEEYEVENFDGLQVSSSYVGLPQDGGSNTIKVKSATPWQLDTAGTVIKKQVWLNFSSLSGEAGESELTISAEAVKGSRTASVRLKNGSQTQIINIVQGKVAITTATVAEVMKGAEGATYRVTGTVTRVANTKYGNFYLNDGTSNTDLYIYGTVDESGSYNWAKFGISEGDEVTVQGPMSNYNGTIELVDAQWISTNKSLVKCDSTYVDGKAGATLPREGGDLTAYVTCKGEGMSVEIPDDAKSWLSISSIDANGTTSAVHFHATENTGSARSTTVTFKTTSGGKEYTSNTTITQNGNIATVSLADFRAAEKGEAQYRLNVLVTRIDKRGNFYVNDYSDLTGEVEIYKPKGDNLKSVTVGSVITVVGKRDQYKSTIEMADPTVESVKPAKAVTAAEFNEAPDGDDLLVISGTIKEIKNERYGNMYIEDETGEVYVYGLFGYGAPDKKNFVSSYGLKAGDKITVVGPKDTYKTTKELKNAWFVSKE